MILYTKEKILALMVRLYRANYIEQCLCLFDLFTYQRSIELKLRQRQ